MYALGFFVVCRICELNFRNTLKADGVSPNLTRQLITLFAALLRLAGLPPFIGFYGKILVLSGLRPTTRRLGSLFLLSAAGIFLFIYTRLCLNLIGHRKKDLEVKPRLSSKTLPFMGRLLVLP